MIARYPNGSPFTLKDYCKAFGIEKTSAELMVYLKKEFPILGDFYYLCEADILKTLKENSHCLHLPVDRVIENRLIYALKYIMEPKETKQ